MNCRFCSLETEQPHCILEKRTQVLVVQSNPRLMPGHLLVIPKRHVEHLSELADPERKELFDTAIDYQKRLMEQMASGCDMVQNNRPFIPEGPLKVNHVHIHLRPREREDELYRKAQIQEKEIFRPLTEKEAADVANRLLH